MFSVVYYIVVFVLVIVFLAISLLVFPFTVPFDRTRRAVHEISRVIAQLFFRLPPAWKTRVEGLENVDRGKVYVIVLNHSSMVDILMLYWVKLNFRWVARDTLRSMPFIGQFMALHGDILIPRDKPRKAAAMVMADGCKWLVGRRVCVAIFPEGTRSRTGEMGRFKPTAFSLAREAGVGILPVVLSGSRVVGKKGGVPWRHDFGVRVLTPVSAEEVVARDPKDIMEETRARMESARAARRGKTK